MATVRQGPAPPPPPPPATTGKGASAVFTAYVNAHPKIKPYSQAISKWAAVYAVDPTYLAALILHESGGNAAAPPSTNTNGTKDYGLARINDIHFGKTVTPWDGQTVTAEKAMTQAYAIRFAAWYFGSKVSAAGGDYVAAYNGAGGYNPGGPDPFTNVPKAYVPAGKGLTPTEAASVSAEQTAATSAAKDVLFDRWAVLTGDGKVKFTKITDAAKPPGNVLKYGPTPLTQTTFLQTWKQVYNDQFFAYTGRQASGKEIASILKNAPSVYTLATTLAGTKWFTSSPTYKAHAPGIVAIVKQELGGEAKVDKSFVAKAISQNWDQATLQQNIKSLPGYENGPTFKDSVAKAGNVYQNIYGNVTPEVTTAMSELVRRGWTNDEVAAWLRNQPEYKNSQEYKTKALSFATSMGLLTNGALPTLTGDQATLGGPPPVPAAPLPAGPPPVAPVRPDDRAGIRGA